ARDVRMPFETDDEWPSVEVGVAGSIFEAPAGAKGKARDVPIGAMNVPMYDLVTAALDEASLVRFVLDESRGPQVCFDAAKRIPGAKTEAVQPGGAANATAVKMVHLDQVLADRKGRGAAVVAVRHNTTRNRPFADTRFVAVTDLAISAKMSRFG